MVPDAPRLSVLIITYNQERYIEQTVRSALMQQTDFPYEIVIGEDCSTDGTRDVLRRLDAEHPGRLRLLFRERNLGIVGNFMETYAACRGAYVAILGGDDYWTDDCKLAKQAAVLDADPKCSVCFHRIRVVDEAGLPSGVTHPINIPQITSRSDILQGCYIPALSAMLRKAAVPIMPEWMARMPFEDWPLFIHFSEFGYFTLLDDNMADYRVHGGGWWSRQSKAKNIYHILKMFVILDEVYRDRLGCDFAKMGCARLEIELNEVQEIKNSLSWRLIRRVLSPLDRLGASRLARALKSRCRPRTATEEAQSHLRAYVDAARNT